VTIQSALTKFVRRALHLSRSAHGSQLVEFAVCLPLLTLVVVGIMDFGSAVTLKHKLDIVVEQAARVASNQTYADITNPLPKSTEAIRSAVVSNLLAMKVNHCGLSTATPGKTGLTWTYNANGCPGTLQLVINRGVVYQNAGNTPEWIEANRVTISYPYQWSFGQVSRLVVPGSTFVGPTQLKAETVVPSLY
jgi:Flp pilus assembly protein TadG